MEPAPTPPGDDDGLTCPWCGAIDVEQIAAYGSLLVTAQWFCNACGSPFERVRHRRAPEGDPHDGAPDDGDSPPDDGDSAPGDDGRAGHGPVTAMAGPVATSTDEAGTSWVVLDRPDVRNAIDVATQEALRDALIAAATDGGVRAIAITGTDPAFSAGGDLSRFDDPDHTAFRFASHDLTDVIGLVERIEKPVVAAINGVATGAGAQLALACDLRIASQRARFLWREGHLGLLPAHGGIARLVHLVGLGRARDLVLGGMEIDAGRAHAIGLVTQVVPHETLRATVSDHLARITRRSPDAYAVTKRVLQAVAGQPVGTGQAVETLGQSLLIGTDEHHVRLRRAREARGDGRDGG